VGTKKKTDISSYDQLSDNLGKNGSIRNRFTQNW